MICIDASVAAKWFFAEEHSAQASGLLRTALEAAEPIIAPPLLPCEVANIIRQRMRQGWLDRAGARAVLARFLAIPITLPVPESLYDRALVLADHYNLPAVYDALYVALAERFGATLWTADQRLLHALDDKLPFVHDVADWRSNRTEI